MTAATVPLLFEQGIPRVLRVRNWKDQSGAVADTSDFAARFQLRRKATDFDGSAIVGLSTDDGSIVALANGFDLNFNIANTLAMTPVDRYRPDIAMPLDSPAYLVGVYELRAWSSGGEPYSVIRGPLYVTLEVVKWPEV